MEIEAQMSYPDHVALKPVLGLDIDFDQSQLLQPARVKWFDRGKGFGFVNVLCIWKFFTHAAWQSYNQARRFVLKQPRGGAVLWRGMFRSGIIQVKAATD